MPEGAVSTPERNTWRVLGGRGDSVHNSRRGIAVMRAEFPILFRRNSADGTFECSFYFTAGWLRMRATQ